MSSSQFPSDSTIFATDLTSISGGNWYPDYLPQIWMRLAILEKQVFGVAQQPPYPVAPAQATPPEDSSSS